MKIKDLTAPPLTETIGRGVNRFRAIGFLKYGMEKKTLVQDQEQFQTGTMTFVTCDKSFTVFAGLGFHCPAQFSRKTLPAFRYSTTFLPS